MQTFASTARIILRWERKSLQNGGYRLDNIERLIVAPELAGYTDCTCLKQFHDELDCVLPKFGPSEGTWLGLRRVDGDSADIIAMLVE